MTAKSTHIVTVGRRKTAIARLRINKIDEAFGITVNNVDFKTYFPTFVQQEAVMEPIKMSGLTKINASVKVSGGGKNAQAVALQHALSRAMVEINEDNRSSLRKSGLLTRDSRRKERKKPGLKRARRAPQWSKR